MRILDREFRHHVLRYLLQCGLATVAILIILLCRHMLLDREILGTAILGALGASAFIVFTMPETRSARPRFLIGGYVVGIAVGCFCYALLHSSLFVDSGEARIVLGGLSVGLAIFLMVITDTEHPPAAGVALGLVLNPWDPSALIPVLGGVMIMSILRYLLKSLLRNLL